MYIYIIIYLTYYIKYAYIKFSVGFGQLDLCYLSGWFEFVGALVGAPAWRCPNCNDCRFHIPEMVGSTTQSFRVWIVSFILCIYIYTYIYTYYISRFIWYTSRVCEDVIQADFYGV